MEGDYRRRRRRRRNSSSSSSSSKRKSVSLERNVVQITPTDYSGWIKMKILPCMICFRTSLCCFTGGHAFSRRGDSFSSNDCGIKGYMENEKMNYGDFLKKAQTGDILLFEGNGKFSCLSTCFTQVRWSHTGIVVRLRNEQTGMNEIFIWESTKPDDTLDFLSGTDKDGPRLVYADEKIYQYASLNYTIAYRQMKINDTRIISDIESGKTDLYMWAVLLQLSRLTYEKDPFELSNAHLRLITGIYSHGNNNDNANSIFCSEQNMYTYRNGMGLSLYDYEDDVTYAPEDFSPEDFAEETEGIPFTKGAIDAYTGGVIRPPQAEFGIQWILASTYDIDPLLRSRYERFVNKRGNRELYRIMQKALDNVRTILINFKNHIEESNRGRNRRDNNNDDDDDDDDDDGNDYDDDKGIRENIDIEKLDFVPIFNVSFSYRIF
jgi:hypothetical protein